MEKDRYTDILSERFGRETPFRVPDGYFDGLVDNVMSHIPNEKASEDPLPKPHAASRRAVIRRLTAAVLMAASVLVAVFVIGGNIDSHQSVPALSSNPSAQSLSIDNSNIDEAMEYSMMDNEDMYTYLAENE
jgi:hypothetical protein